MQILGACRRAGHVYQGPQASIKTASVNCLAGIVVIVSRQGELDVFYGTLLQTRLSRFGHGQHLNPGI